MQLRALNQLTKGQCALGPRRRFGLVLWWRRSAAARVGRRLPKSGGREVSIDGLKLDGRVRRTGSEGQVAWGLTRRVGEHRSIIMRKQRGMSKGLNNRLDIPSKDALPDLDLV